MIGSLLYRLELFSVCSSDGIMSDWATILGVPYSTTERELLLQRNAEVAGEFLLSIAVCWLWR